VVSDHSPNLLGKNVNTIKNTKKFFAMIVAMLIWKQSQTQYEWAYTLLLPYKNRLQSYNTTTVRTTNRFFENVAKFKLCENGSKKS
jgi:hypothetical protein